jgi:hypothetical protein
MHVAVGHAEFHHAGNFLPEANAASAMNATRHFLHRDQRTDILVENDAFVFLKTRGAAAVTDRQILQLALATLVADRAIQRVIDQQELHHAFLRLDRQFGMSEHLHAVGRPVSRRQAGASAPSRPAPDTSGNWQRSRASCDSRNAGYRPPTAVAASMMVLPSGTCAILPSISISIVSYPKPLP